MRVRIKEKFILSPYFKGNDREFPDGGGKVDAGPCTDNKEDRHFLAFPFGHRSWKTISEEILAKLASALDVSPDELRQYDARLRTQKLGFAFRTVVEKVKNGELTAEDIIVKLSTRKSRA
jgi:hypothetical protein